MREVCLLIGRGGAVLWSDTSDSPLALVDSRARWEAIWRHRDELEAIVHSHPAGPHAFSREDETTMDAVDAALGKGLRYVVVSPQGLVVREGGREVEPGEATPWWVPLLKLASGM
ncbi:MAG: Mov34/MPN/PAD-1 family protein [Myxococcota bacterium]